MSRRVERVALTLAVSSFLAIFMVIATVPKRLVTGPCVVLLGLEAVSVAVFSIAACINFRRAGRR